jgi:uroporphyrinogen III methyltransferase / synthase
MPTSTGPLQGVCVMVTRPAESADPLVERLRAFGAEVIVRPAIRIGPPADWQPVDDALARLAEFDWLVFSSANGVRYLLERWLHGDCPNSRASENGTVPSAASGLPRLAAIGPGTADALVRYGLHADVLPEQFRAESLAESLAPQAAGKRFLLARASRGRPTLAQRLIAAGAAVEQIVVYRSDDVERPDPETSAMLRDGRIDWVTVTSSSIARRLVAWFGDDLRNARLASISPITSGVLRELGHRPAVEAAQYTLAGLAAAMAAAQPA